MKVKFINPMKLMRTHDCFIHDGDINYDYDGEIKTPKQYQAKQTNNIVTFHTYYDLERLDFDKYYKVEEEIDTVEKFLELEEEFDAFFIDDSDLNLYFIAVPDRDYYELYDDDLNLIEKMVDRDED